MRSDYDRPVGESKLGDAFLALLLLPCVGITGAVLVAGVVIYTRERTLGGAREMTSLALAAVLFPLLTRALYVVAARVFGKKIEPLVPWWLAAAPAVLFSGLMVQAGVTGSPLNIPRLAVLLVLMVSAPVALYRQQHGRKAGPAT